MKKWLSLIFVVLLLAGCGQRRSPSPLPGGEAVGDAGNLWYLPCEAVESMTVRQMLETEDGLLLCGAGELKLLSREDLSVKAETPLAAGGQAYVQVLEDGVGIADPASNTVTLLTDDLRPADTLTCEAGSKIWLLSPDAATLYALSQEGLWAWDLGTGTSRELLRSRVMSVVSLTGETLFLSTVLQTDLMTRWYALELEQGSLTELTDSPMIALQEGLRPQSNGAYLRWDGQTVTQYDPDGSFVSSCTLPKSFGSPGPDFVWSETWQGWFFLARSEEDCRLMFWDPARETEGADMDLLPEPIPEGVLLPRELYDRAEELSRRFDLDIRIADRAIRSYSSYSADMLTDPEITAHALDVLEAALSAYPEGFFTQLKYNNRHAVRIELVDALAAKSDKDVSSGTSAFTGHRDRYSVVVLNAPLIQEAVLFHEVSHIIDKRLAWDARLREDALYSEEDWLALQPEGFEYAGSYTNIPEHVKKFYDSGYFVQDYACVSASEDRATVLEKAMAGEQRVFDANPHLMPKLRYYCDCIRDSFDTTGWPGVTRWEQLLP